MNSIFEVEETRLLDKASESSYAFWNALLTLNGIILSVFSAAAVIDSSINRLLILVLFASCFTSLLLLLKNYSVTKDLYKSMGEITQEKFDKMTEDDLGRLVYRAERMHTNLLKREKVSKFLLLFEIIIILLMILSSYWGEFLVSVIK